MNVLLHELRAHLKSIVIWSICLFALMVASFMKFDAINAQGGTATHDLLQAFPRSIQAIFGMNGLDLTMIGGYFGACFLILAVALALHAGLTGMSVLAEEETDHTTEFLYVKPRARSQIVTAKLFAGLILIAVAWGAGVAGSIIGITQFAHFGDFTSDFWRMMIAAALIQVLFLLAGMATAAATKRTAWQGKIITLAIGGSYMFHVLANISNTFSWVHYVSVFSWFDAADILNTHTLKLHYLVATACLYAVFLLVIYICYRRRDLNT